MEKNFSLRPFPEKRKESVSGWKFRLRAERQVSRMIRAVICDDEPAAANIIRHFIEGEKLPIEIVGTAENGREALNLIEKEKPELVFMDIHMPCMNGFEVISQAPESKFIIITAYDSFLYAQKALRLGASDILSKPIELEQLRDAINSAVGWKFTSNDTVNQMLQYIHSHFTENISLEQLSDLTFCTKSYLARLFKKYMDISILNYIHRLRIEKAVSYLKEGRMTIQEIAEAVGYQNLNNFYKYFKQEKGETPAVFLQNWKRQK